MEQAIWLYFGVIAVLVGIAIVVQIVVFNVEKEKEITMESSLNQLANFCEFICLSDLNQMLSQEVKFSSGSRVFSQQKALCYEYKENTHCRDCKCEIFDASDFEAGTYYVLDLNSPDVLELYNTHTFDCTFTRVQPEIDGNKVDGVTLECRG